MSRDGEAVSVKWCLLEFRKLINDGTWMMELRGVLCRCVLRIMVWSA